MPLFAGKRDDGVDGRIRLLKRELEKRTQIPFTAMPYLFLLHPIQGPGLDQNNELNPV